MNPQLLAERVVDAGVRSAAVIGSRIAPHRRMVPAFLIIGAQRAGTTSLYSYLTQHPDVVGALTKEIHFFDNGYQRGRSWYAAHFPPRRWVQLRRRGDGVAVTGEASPYYLFHPLAAERARQALPQAKLIVLLRDPVERAVSHYHHEVAKGFETLPFEVALHREPERLAGEHDRLVADPSYRSFAHQHFSYLSRGVYVDQLRAWRAHFPEEQMLVLNSDEFFAEPAVHHRRVLAFLGLRPIALTAYKRHNTYRRTQIAAEAHRRLVDFFEEPNRRLYRYLGTDFGWNRWTRA